MFLQQKVRSRPHPVKAAQPRERQNFEVFRILEGGSRKRKTFQAYVWPKGGQHTTGCVESLTLANRVPWPGGAREEAVCRLGARGFYGGAQF